MKRMKRVIATIALLLTLSGTALAQSVTIGLAWDHDGVGLDLTPSGFILERKQGQNGTYAQVGGLIPAADRTAADTFPIGQLYCYQVRAKNAFITSAPSNEVCLIEATRPFNLRIQ